LSFAVLRYSGRHLGPQLAARAAGIDDEDMGGVVYRRAAEQCPVLSDIRLAPFPVALSLSETVHHYKYSGEKRFCCAAS